MHHKAIFADKFTFSSMLSACAALADIETGKRIHASHVFNGHLSAARLHTALINMYCKCKNVKHARDVFDGMRHNDIILWNCMITGYAQMGYGEDALQLLYKMLCEGMAPNAVTFIVIINACFALLDGQIMHTWLAEDGLDMDIKSGSALVNMYCTFGSLCDALCVFDIMPERNLITWNSLIAGYVAYNYADDALELFNIMQDGGINPDRITWSMILDTCASFDSLAEGELVYNSIMIIGLELDNSIVASAMKLYGKFYCLDISKVLFRRVLNKDFLLWNAVIMLTAQHGLLNESCELLVEMYQCGLVPDCQIFVDLLGACTKQMHFCEGRYLHSIATLQGIDTNSSIINALINMYGTCSSLEDSWRLFEVAGDRNGLLWTSIIGVYTFHGNNAHAISLYLEMHKGNTSLDKMMSTKLLQACSKEDFLSAGQNMHADIIIKGFDLDVVVENALIDMYKRCGSLMDAERVFETMPTQDIVSWNTMIAAYSEHNDVTKVFQCLLRMEKGGVDPDQVTYLNVISVLTWVNASHDLNLIYNCITYSSFEADSNIVSSLIYFYGKLGYLVDAYNLFQRTLFQDIQVWNALISAHIEQGRTAEAVGFFSRMQNEGILAEKVSYRCVLSAFSGLSNLSTAKRLHACIIGSGYSQDVLVNSALLSLYGRCCSLKDAYTLFYIMAERDEVSWSALLRASSDLGSFTEASQLFERMLEEALLPNSTVILNFLLACTEYKALINGLRCHSCLLFSPFASNTAITNAILNMYCEFGLITDVDRSFVAAQEHDVVSFNIIIKSYMHADHPQEALKIFTQMVTEGFIPDAVTLMSALDVCGSLGNYFQGKVVHIALMCGKMSESAANNAAITMYSNCGYLEDALEAFNLIPSRDVAAWNSIITEEHLESGRLLHHFIVTLELEQEITVGNSLIAMYGRCGASNEAERVFEGLVEKTTATWNAVLVSGILQVTAKLDVIESMQEDGISPNEITVTYLLDFCSNNGAADRGMFLHMHVIFCAFELDVSIATSLVNLYGKCGMLKDARNIFEKTGTKNLLTWTAMLTAYACHGLVEEALLLLPHLENETLMADAVTFSSILSACDHCGSLSIGEWFLVEISYIRMASVIHFDCVIDLLSRMGQVTRARSIAWSMPFQPTPISWTVLLAACQNLGNIERADHIITHMIELNYQNYV
ncbi:hypothetical protein KP509_14G066900 [Ceratopteris richardii]|uniref:Pentatricopeptide repeat-containing protein n=1 Tax=Ceratopteris richardii TaxID=49495 RepID=A0A8T2T8U5_CERRI|nr:hypothetical protein KP509_14G066900 [Ceratopteris richardii]